MTKTDKKFTLI